MFSLETEFIIGVVSHQGGLLLRVPHYGKKDKMIFFLSVCVNCQNIHDLLFLYTFFLLNCGVFLSYRKFSLQHNTHIY